jgi:hypothetical protein
VVVEGVILADSIRVAPRAAEAALQRMHGCG